MPDYGHELRFGSFVTPDAARPQHVADPALLSGGRTALGTGTCRSGGDLVRAGDDENQDLFWAMRGAGANFGVAVAFEIDAHPVGEQVGFAMLTFVPDDLAAFLHGWGAAIEDAHPSVTGTLMTGPAPRGRRAAVQALVMVDSGDADTVAERLLPLFEGTYLSFETDTGPDALARAFPPAHLRRLRELKRRWDPTGLFRDNVPIEPADS